MCESVTHMSKRWPSGDDGHFMERVAVLGVVRNESVATFVIGGHQVNLFVWDAGLLLRAWTE